MATARLTASPEFLAPAVLSAYPRLRWAGLPPVAGDTPRAAAVTTAVVDPFGYATLEGLEAGETYYVGALVTGSWLWKTISTPPASPGGTGGASIPAVEALEGEMTAETAARISADAGLAASIAGLSGSSGQSEAQVNEQIQAVAPLTGIVWPLGTIAVNGFPELDLRKGRVFTGTASGAWKLKAPTHPPATPTNEALFVEVRIAASVAPTREGIGLEGEAPVPSGGVWCAELVSRDNGATWAVIGPPPPPTDVLRITSPADETLAFFHEAAWKALAIASVRGLTEGQVKEIAAAEAAVAASSGAALGRVRMGTGANTTAWEDFESLVNERATSRVAVSGPITASASISGPIYPTAIVNNSKVATLSERARQELHVGQIVTGTGIPGSTVIAALLSPTTIELSKEATSTKTTLASYAYRNFMLPVLAAGVTLTLEPTALLGGQLITVANLSSGTIKVSGRFIFNATTALTATSTTAVVPSTSTFAVGMRVVMPGVPVNTTIASITDSTHVVLSAAATITETALGQYEPIVNTTLEVPVGETVTYIATTFSGLQVFATARSVPAIEALIAAADAGEWAVLTGLSAKLEAVEGVNAYGARAEASGNIARLRGKMKVKAGETLKAGNKVATVPTGRRPSYEVWNNSETLSIATNGEVVYHGADLVATTVLSLEGISYPLT